MPNGIVLLVLRLPEIGRGEVVYCVTMSRCKFSRWCRFYGITSRSKSGGSVGIVESWAGVNTGGVGIVKSQAGVNQDDVGILES